MYKVQNAYDSTSKKQFCKIISLDTFFIYDLCFDKAGEGSVPMKIRSPFFLEKPGMPTKTIFIKRNFFFFVLIT